MRRAYTLKNPGIDIAMSSKSTAAEELRGNIGQENYLAIEWEVAMKEPILKNQEGAIGYLLAWLLGVPASILLLIFLIKG